MEEEKPPRGSQPLSDEREERIASGLAMMAMGSSERVAGEAVGVPKSTLHDRFIKLNPGGSDHEERLREVEAEMVSRFAVLTLASAEHLSEQLEAGRLSNREVITTMGVAADKFAAKRQWNRAVGAGDGDAMGSLAEALKKLPAGGKMTVTVEAEQEAIDVTPSKG